MFRTRLAWELAWVIAIKVVALALIWVFFVREYHTSVDSAGMVTALRLSMSQPDNHPRRAIHDQ